MKRGGLSVRFKQHLLKTVGKPPLNSEIKLIDKRLRRSFNKIYDSPNKSQSFLKREYDQRLSKAWPRVVANEASLAEVNLFRRYSKIKEESNLLSIASGIAVFELFVAKEFASKGKVTCIDISEGMSDQARKYLKRLKLNNVNLIVKDVSKIPLGKNSQDIVLARRTGLSNDDKWINILKEVYRVLKKDKNSRFIYTVDHDFTKPINQIKKDLLKAKLKLIRQDHFTKRNRIDMIVARPLSLFNAVSNPLRP